MRKNKNEQLVRKVYKYLIDAEVLNLKVKTFKQFYGAWKRSDPVLRRGLVFLYNNSLESVTQALDVKAHRSIHLLSPKAQFGLDLSIKKDLSVELRLFKNIGQNKYVPLSRSEYDYKFDKKHYSEKEDRSEIGGKLKDARYLYKQAYSIISQMLAYMHKLKTKIDSDLGKSWDTTVLFYAIYISDGGTENYGFQVTWHDVRNTVAEWGERVISWLDPIIAVDNLLANLSSGLVLDPSLYSHFYELTKAIGEWVVIEHPKGDFHEVHLGKMKAEFDIGVKGPQRLAYENVLKIGDVYLSLFSQIFGILKILKKQIEGRISRLQLTTKWEEWSQLFKEQFQKV